MKIVREERLIARGRYANSRHWRQTRARLHKAIRRVDWPPGSGKFTIYPESGKGRGQGNGVIPIKAGLMEELRQQGWKLEHPLSFGLPKGPGKFDAVLDTRYRHCRWTALGR